MAELVAGIGHGQRLRAFGQVIAGKKRGQLVIAVTGNVKTKLLRQWAVEPDQLRHRRMRGRGFEPKPFKIARVAVVKRK